MTEFTDGFTDYQDDPKEERPFRIEMNGIDWWPPIKSITSIERWHDYLNSWRSGTVTLEEWLQFRDIDHEIYIFEHDTDLHLDEQEIETGIYKTVRSRQRELFKKLIDKIFENDLKKAFESLPEKEKKELAGRDIKLLNDLFQGCFEGITEARLKAAFGITDPQKVFLQNDSKMHGRLENFNILNKDSFLHLEVLLTYRQFLSDYLMVNRNIKKSRPKNYNTFSIKPGQKDKLEKIYTELNELKGGFVDTAVTSLEDFVTIFSSPDISKEKKIRVQFTCDNPTIKYVIDKMSVMFNHSMLQVIKKSEEFFSKGGTVITDNSLSRAGSKTPNPKQKKEIDKIFNKLLNGVK